MNIKKFFLDENKAKKIEENLELKKYFETINLDIRKVYMELNLGGLLDDLPLDARTVLEKSIQDILEKLQFLLVFSLGQVYGEKMKNGLQIIFETLSDITIKIQQNPQQNTDPPFGFYS